MAIITPSNAKTAADGSVLKDALVIIDIETTGISPTGAAITEIAAIKYCGKTLLGEFQTLINPEEKIPSVITNLTGITNAMVKSKPVINEVLPLLLEFLGSPRNTFIGGHNVNFDISFLNFALQASERKKLRHKKIDTLFLARKLIPGEVPNFRLNTLAQYFKVKTEPSHRALADARATVEVLHALMDRAATDGVDLPKGLTI